MKTYLEPQTVLPVYDECDVLVAGGGSAGHSAIAFQCHFLHEFRQDVKHRSRDHRTQDIAHTAQNHEHQNVDGGVEVELGSGQRRVVQTVQGTCHACLEGRHHEGLQTESSNIDTNRLTPLRHEEFVVLLNAARLYLNNFNEIAVKHSQLKTDDLYYICLVILGLNAILDFISFVETIIIKMVDNILNIIIVQ